MVNGPTFQPVKHDPYEAFRYASFRRFAVSYVLAVVGSQVLSATVQWDVYQQTKDAFVIGLVGLINAIPVILFALPAGHIADRFSRKRVLLVTQVPLALCPAALAVLRAWNPEGLSLVVTLSLLGINATALTFARPARSSIVPNLVPRVAFSNAFAWMSSLFETAAWVGPAVSGLLIVFDVAWSYLMSALCLAVCFAITLFLPRDEPAEATKHEWGWGSLSAGLRFVLDSPLLLAAMTLDLLAVLLGGATYLLPVFAERLGVQSIGYGWMRAAPALGAFMMAVLQAHRTPTMRAGRTLLWSVAAFGAATIVFGLSQDFWLSLVMLFIIGASDNISVVIRQTLVQSLTPDTMRGRVSAVNQVFIGASNELGGLESGVTAKLFGPIASVVGGGIGTILVVVGVAKKWPQIRQLRSLKELHAAVEAKSEHDADVVE
ncbi:MFS transporter [Schlesneria paludicola]|uniref:MFS transporter n=1 Tax=Schlesneria paludicola TaxID=360056 RepID=UPI00029AF6CB|nr:MFS transporter [Schlesneria paludicola]